MNHCSSASCRRRPCLPQHVVLLADVDHAYLGMLLAEDRLPASLHIEARFPRP